MRKKALTVFISIFIVLASVQAGMAQDKAETQNYDKVNKVIVRYLKERAKYSGTLDIYDEKLDKVRNLKKLGVAQEVEKNENVYTKLIDYRDMNMGDVLTVKISVVEENGELEVLDPEILKVENKSAAKPTDTAVKKEFTDEDINKAMKDYFDQKMQFTGTFDLFDPAQEKMKKLKLIKVDSKIRKFGSLNISSVEFSDVETGKTVIVDITVENKNGKLSISNVREKE